MPFGIRFDPYIGCNFVVLRSPVPMGGFREVSGLEGNIELKSYAEGGRNGYMRQFPGEVRWPNLVLSRGVIDSNLLWEWYEDVSRGIIQRRTLVVMLLDASGLPAMYWTVMGAIPAKWTGPRLNATSDEIAVESLEFNHQGISRPTFSKVLTNLRAAADVARALSPPPFPKVVQVVSGAVSTTVRVASPAVRNAEGNVQQAVGSAATQVGNVAGNVVRNTGI